MDLKKGFSGIQGTFRRQAVQIDSESLVRTRPLFPGGTLPLLLEPAVEAVNLTAWARGERERLKTWLHRHGGILFRGFNIPDSAAFRDLADAVAGPLLSYGERSSPRSQVQTGVYTSTDYPQNQAIFLHNENSYQGTWPMKIFFYCEQPARVGGETPIADCRRIFHRLPPAIRDKFAAKGIRYMRNYSPGLGLPWQEVFQTADRSAVEAHCRASGLEWAWKSGDRLRTKAVRPLVARHPATGEETWFNHATFFNMATLDDSVRRTLERDLAEDDLPRHTYYGDGEQIEADVVRQLQAAYREETLAFPWQRGDVLLLENMLAAHGRAPFEGERRVLVAMAEPMDLATALKASP